MRQLRALYLRTFGGTKEDHAIIASIAQALSTNGRVIVMGDGAGRQELLRFWKRVYGNHNNFERCIEYIKSDSSSWKIEIHRQIVNADIIIAFVSSKGASFPQLNHAPPGDISRGDYLEFLDQVYSAPLSKHMSGVGLLKEISYLQRLGAIPRVITICLKTQFDEIINLIKLAEFASHGFAHSATWRKVIAPRMTVLDQQLRWIDATCGPLPFKDPAPGSHVVDGLAEQLIPAFNDVLSGRTKSRYEERWGTLEFVYPPGTPDSGLPVGRFHVARPLPPDRRNKVFRYWKIEDLNSIPTGEVIDLSLRDARRLLSREAVKRGCPYCYAPINELCFHAYGLVWPSNEAVRAKCQTCGRRSSLWGDMLMDI